MTFDLERARRTTPARPTPSRAGVRPPTAAWLAFLADHAAARDAVWSEWSVAFLDRLRALGFLLVASAAPDRMAYVREPPLGRRLAAGELERIRDDVGDGNAPVADGDRRAERSQRCKPLAQRRPELLEVRFGRARREAV